MGSELSRLLEAIETYISDPRVGLPQEFFYFISRFTPLVNVDLLIKNKDGKTLLTWRDDQFYGPAWHIPGGIIRFKENIEERIMKVAEAELGCTVRCSHEPVNVCSLVNKQRDVRGHFISLLYLCELTSDPIVEKEYVSGYPFPGQWAWHAGSPENLLSVHEPFRDFIDGTPPL